MTVLSKLLSTTSPNVFTFNITMLVYRMIIAFGMIKVHGWKKITDIQGTIQHIPDPFGIGGELSAYTAIAANIFFAGFVGLGLFTRGSAIFILSLTLVGFFIVHGNDPWPIRDTPMMYSAAFGLVAIFGPGKYSLDKQLFKK